LLETYPDGTCKIQILDGLSEPENPSPADLILREAKKIQGLGSDFDQERSFQTDLRQALGLVQIVFDSLCGLENLCNKKPKDIINTLGWFCYTIYVQVLEGNRDTIAGLFRELSSDDIVQLGDQYERSMTEILLKLQAAAVIAMRDVLHCFSPALSAVPSDFPKRLEDASKFGSAVAQAVSGENICHLESPWKEVAEHFLGSVSFREEIANLQLDAFVDFVRRKVKLIGNEERICAEIRKEFTKAEKARLNAGKAISPQWMSASAAIEMTEQTDRPVSASVLSKKARETPPAFESREATHGKAKLEVEIASFLKWFHNEWLPGAPEKDDREVIECRKRQIPKTP
jgi:hypothetical protein